MEPIRGYCVRCQATRELRDTKQIHRSGIPTVEGKCAGCGGTVFVLGAGAPAPVDDPDEP